MGEFFGAPHTAFQGTGGLRRGIVVVKGHHRASGKCTAAFPLSTPYHLINTLFDMQRGVCWSVRWSHNRDLLWVFGICTLCIPQSKDLFRNIWSNVIPSPSFTMLDRKIFIKIQQKSCSIRDFNNCNSWSFDYGQTTRITTRMLLLLPSRIIRNPSTNHLTLPTIILFFSFGVKGNKK